MHCLHAQANAVTKARICSTADRRRQACTFALTISDLYGVSKYLGCRTRHLRHGDWPGGAGSDPAPHDL
jgi:hypothetical protein